MHPTLQQMQFRDKHYYLKWKALRNKTLAKGETTEFNFFAGDTFVYICALILAHVSMIEIYCVQQKEEINPRSMNTNTAEWTFGNKR